MMNNMNDSRNYDRGLDDTNTQWSHEKINFKLHKSIVLLTMTTFKTEVQGPRWLL